MWSICKKELRQFFSSLTGYIAIIVFLLVNGLVLFVFRNNILETGYATLEAFFDFAPWILIFLIPAITMRSFADEYRGGTFEVLRTRPLTGWQIVGGKFWGDRAFDFLDRWIGVRGGEIEENVADPCEQLPGTFECDDGVGERGLF